MSKSIKVKTNTKREVVPYVELWDVANFLYYNGKEKDDGQNFKYMASLVFQAFTFEAYLNHIGPKLFKSWDNLEKLGPIDKLNIIAEKLNVKVDIGACPWQSINELFKYRNFIVHGKSMTIEDDKIIPIEDFNIITKPNYLKSKWDIYCNEKNIIKNQKDIKEIVLIFYDAGRFEEYPFVSGFQTEGASIIQE
jgi:hypothetical protein